MITRSKFFAGFDLTRLGILPFLLRGLIAVAIAIMVTAVFGAILAIPTDMGRIFAYSASLFVVLFYVFSIPSFIAAKLLLRLREVRIQGTPSIFSRLRSSRIMRQEQNEAILTLLATTSTRKDLERARIVLQTSPEIGSILKRYLLDATFRAQVQDSYKLGYLGSSSSSGDSLLTSHREWGQVLQSSNNEETGPEKTGQAQL